jgi:glycosyltransferase involved in cell wall biosynthesis
VRILGFRDDVASIVAAADALVLSSDHEGLPVAVMEAFALGTPVVATAVGGVPEAVTDGTSGLLVPPRDPGALATALQRLADDAPLRAELASGAAARASAFDAAATTATIESIYRRVLDAR